MRKINKLIIHCSASGFGNAALIDQWHRERGFDCIGYHYIVLNGFARPGVYIEALDGAIEDGRPEQKIGAHCKGNNSHSLGICLIGEPDADRPGHCSFSGRQMTSLTDMCLNLLQKYKISPSEVYGHNEFDSSKVCPGMDMLAYRAVLRKRLERVGNA